MQSLFTAEDTELTEEARDFSLFALRLLLNQIRPKSGRRLAPIRVPCLHETSHCFAFATSSVMSSAWSPGANSCTAAMTESSRTWALWQW